MNFLLWLHNLSKHSNILVYHFLAFWLRSSVVSVLISLISDKLSIGDGQGGLACCSPWVTKSQSRLNE